jgi:hypothetical protein
LWWDDDDATVGGSQTVNIGTVFPSSPAPWDRFFRTDMGMEFYWDGSRWLSSQLYTVPLVSDLVFPLTTTGTFRSNLVPPVAGVTGLLLVSLTCAFYVATGGTALGASHNWVGTLSAYGPSGTTSGTIAALLRIDSGALNDWRSFAAVPVNYVASPYAQLQLSFVKTGTPGNLYTLLSHHFRYIAA